MTEYVDKAVAWDAVADKGEQIVYLKAQISNLQAENARLREVLDDVRKTAALLYQNTLSANPKLHQGLPGWLIDCKQSIDNADATLNKETEGSA